MTDERKTPHAAPKLSVWISTEVDGAAVYDEDGKLIDTGHVDDVMERLLPRLGCAPKYGAILVDEWAPGLSGIAQTQAEVEELNR